MKARHVNAAAGVIAAAMGQGKRTPAGLAVALDSAGLLNSPEHATEFARMRDQLAEFERPADEDPIAYALTDQAEATAPDETHMCGIPLTRRLECGHCPHEVCEDCDRCPCSCRCADVTPQVRKLQALLAGQRDQAEAEDPARCLTAHPFTPRDGWRTVCGNCDHAKNAPCHRGGDA